MWWRIARHTESPQWFCKVGEQPGKYGGLEVVK